MKNKNIIYGIGGIIIGLLVMLPFSHNILNTKTSMHQMPDNTMMAGNDMASMMHDMNASLTGKAGDAFDKAFLSEMIVHHLGAVEMAEQVLVKSKRPELISLANDIIKAQNDEIRMMQDWQKSWFK